MRISIADATVTDLIDVATRLRAADRRELAISRDVDRWDQLVLDVMDAVQCKVARLEGHPVMAFGAVLVDPVTVTVWGFGSDDAAKVGPAVTRHVRQRMIPFLKGLGITRAQCAVDPGNNLSRRWLAFLGFRPEAYVPGMGNRLLTYARGAE